VRGWNIVLNCVGFEFVVTNGFGSVRRGQRPRDLLQRGEVWLRPRAAVGWMVRPETYFSEIVRAYQERFNLARSVSDVRA